MKQYHGVFFILGTGRCGTLTLSRVLDSISNCLCLHEGATQDRREKLSPLVDEFAHAYRQRDSITELKALFGQHRVDYFHRALAQGLHIGEANPYIYPFLQYLNHEFPGCRFIHMIRNGYDNVISWEARKRSTYPKPGKRVKRAALAKPSPGPEDEFYPMWPGFTRRQKIAWFWAHVNNLIADFLQPLPAERKRLVKLEELDEATIDRLADFLGLAHDWNRELLQVHHKSDKPLRKVWSEKELAQFHQIAAATMERFGYPLQAVETC